MKMLETMNNASEISKAEAEVSEMNSVFMRDSFILWFFFTKRLIQSSGVFQTSKK